LSHRIVPSELYAARRFSAFGLREGTRKPASGAVIVRIRQGSRRSNLSIVNDQEFIGEKVDKIVEPLPIDCSRHSLANTMLHPDPDQLADDEGAPHGSV
jgi:hypothetical protein